MSDLSCILTSMGMRDPADALLIVNAIEVLRAGEGNSVVFVNDNPDFNGQPNAKVICCADWTGWTEREFGGDTAMEALIAALVASTGRAVPDPASPWSPAGKGSVERLIGKFRRSAPTMATPVNLQGSGPGPIAPREG